MLIGLTQLNTRCSNGGKRSGKKLTGKPTAVIAEGKLIGIRLKLGSPAMIGVQKENLLVADRYMDPLHIIRRSKKNFGQKGGSF